jgi:hypothetical protein
MFRSKKLQQFKRGDLVWAKNPCWIYSKENLPEHSKTPRQVDEAVHSGLPLVFIEVIPKDQWSEWMHDGDPHADFSWCLVFYSGQEWVVEMSNITQKQPEVGF